MTASYERNNARFSFPVILRCNFFEGGVFIDPFTISEVEIWRDGEGEYNGGTLVDVVAGTNIYRDGVGQYHFTWDPISDSSSPSPTGSPVYSPGKYSPFSPSNVIPQCTYWDVWKYSLTPTSPIFHSVGLHTYLYPDFSFCSAGTETFRFELKPDRKRIIKGENLDIRLGIIPIPLFRSRRDPIVDYLLPICTMRVQVLDPQYSVIVPWQYIMFTGKEGIFPTQNITALQLGEYFLMVELGLPNGETIRYPRYAIQMID